MSHVDTALNRNGSFVQANIYMGYTSTTVLFIVYLRFKFNWTL